MGTLTVGPYTYHLTRTVSTPAQHPVNSHPSLMNNGGMKKRAADVRLILCVGLETGLSLRLLFPACGSCPLTRLPCLTSVEKDVPSPAMTWCA